MTHTEDSHSHPNRADSDSYFPLKGWAKFSAIVALFNLILVLFDFSYIPGRDFYFRYFPGLVRFCDSFKGIEPHPLTQRYLNAVDELLAQAPEKGSRSPETERILTSLQLQSTALIEDNLFMGASQWGTLATIERRMRHRVGTVSPKEAFKKFWTRDYLTQNGWDKELNFFKAEIQPLMEANYFRQVDNSGYFIDNFWKIDIFFIGFFGIEFVVMTFLLSRRQAGVSWWDIMLRRWYDVLLLVPVWRGLRAIPVTVRLHKSGLVNLDRAIAQMTHEPATYLADLVSKFVIVRFINQAQNAIEQGDAARFLLNPQPYIQVNDINELEEIGNRLLNLAINKVLPQVQPNLEALVHHTLETTLKQSDFYQNIQQIPGIGALPAQVTEQIANNLAEATVETLSTSYSDTQGREIFDRLKQDFTEAFRGELQDKETLSELQSLLTDFLEEVKLNYVVRANDSEAQAIMEEVTQLDRDLESSSADNSETLEDPKLSEEN